MPTIRKYDEFPVAATLDGTERVLIEQDDANVIATTQDIADLAGAPGPGSIDTTQLADHAVTNIKLAQMPALSFKTNLTGAPADAADNDAPSTGAALSPYIIQQLCQRMESAQIATGTMLCLVDAGSGGVARIIALGTGGTVNEVDLTTGVSTSHTVSGGYGAVDFAAAIFDPTTGYIYAVSADGVKIVRIDPATWAGTTIYSSTALLNTLVGIPAHHQFVVAIPGGAMMLYDTQTETATSYAPLSGSEVWQAIGYDLASDCVYGLADSGIVTSTDIMFRIPRVGFNSNTNATATGQPGTSGNSARCNLACKNGKAFFAIVGFAQGSSWDISGSTPVAGHTLSGRFGGGAMLAEHSNGYIYMLGGFGREVVFKLSAATLFGYAVAQEPIVSTATAALMPGKHIIVGNDDYIYVLTNGGGTGPTVMQVIP